MKTLLLRCLGFIFVLNFLTAHTALCDTEATAPLSKTLSAAGKRRLQQNLAVLEQNLKDTESNIAITQQNTKTLEGELKELEDLEKEHVEMTRKFTAYLGDAAKEMEKNDKAIHDLEKFERTIASAPRGAAEKNQKQLETAQSEKVERQRWKAEAKLKMDRVSQLLKEAGENIRTIGSRKAPIVKQMKSLASRQQEYEKLFKEIEGKKADVEKLAIQ